jgi:serine/threonine-protein kinase HipA
MITILIDMTEGVVAEVEALLPAEFPKDVSDKIFAGLRQQSAKLAAP